MLGIKSVVMDGILRVLLWTRSRALKAEREAGIWEKSQVDQV